MISRILYHTVLLHFGKLIAQSTAIDIQIICQLLTVIWNKKRITSEMLSAF